MVVKLVPTNVPARVISAGFMDLANPEADFYSNTAVYNGNTILEEHPYNLVLTPKGGDGPLPIAHQPTGLVD